MKYSRMNRHSSRLNKNQSKAVRLCIKQHCNEAIKRTKKDKTISEKVRAELIACHNRCKL